MNMNLRQIGLTTCLFAIFILGVTLNGCTLATPPAKQTTSDTSNAPTIETTAMPLPTLPENRQPRALETPLTLIITETRVPAKEAQRIALVFQWRGGIAGRNDMWTIYENGLVRSNKGIDQNIGAEVVQKLLSDIDGLGYFALNEKYGSPGCADCFEYSILAYKDANGQPQKKAVFSVEDGKLPESLSKIIAAIREVVAPTI